MYKPACLQKNFHGRLLSIRVFSADGHYLNNRVFLSRNYRLIVAPQKFDVLKTNICPRSEASRANMLVLRTSNFQEATIRSIVPKHKALANEDTLLRTHCCPWCCLGCANWETFVADTKCFWTKSETFLCPGHKICVRNKCCARGQTGKHLCRQQCVCNNVCSFARP